MVSSWRLLWAHVVTGKDMAWTCRGMTGMFARAPRPMVYLASPPRPTGAGIPHLGNVGSFRSAHLSTVVGLRCRAAEGWAASYIWSPNRSPKRCHRLTWKPPSRRTASLPEHYPGNWTDFRYRLHGGLRKPRLLCDDGGADRRARGGARCSQGLHGRVFTRRTQRRTDVTTRSG